MTDEKKPPGEYSRFKELLDKIAKVPKAEASEKERELRERQPSRKKKLGGSGPVAVDALIVR